MILYLLHPRLELSQCTRTKHSILNCILLAAHRSTQASVIILTPLLGTTCTADTLRLRYRPIILWAAIQAPHFSILIRTPNMPRGCIHSLDQYPRTPSLVVAPVE